MTKEDEPGTAFRLLPEWAKQETIVLIWPDGLTDWSYILDEIRQTYVSFIENITRFEPVWLIVRDEAEAKAWLAGKLNSQAMKTVRLLQADYNDTWARDTMPLTLSDGKGRLRMADFRFNGWGEKFASERDNLLGRELHRQGVFSCEMTHWDDFVLEGGSIETDGEGNLFTTSPCLLAPHRNQPLTKEEIDERLRKTLGVRQVYWIGHGALEGDDTDGHIDTLVRCAPRHTLLYVGCDDENDPQYAGLKAMEEDLLAINRATDTPYRLLRLPMPDIIRDEDGARLPATYANFLVVNGAVIVPTYGQKGNDAEAKRVVEAAFPGYEVVGVDARTVIRQHGSLHCLSMQIPIGVTQG